MDGDDLDSWSVLEGEMYQLSHMLTDQKSIMNSLMELSLTGENGQCADLPLIHNQLSRIPCCHSMKVMYIESM